jgi:hypothetical protein
MGLTNFRLKIDDRKHGAHRLVGKAPVIWCKARRISPQLAQVVYSSKFVDFCISQPDG